MQPKLPAVPIPGANKGDWVCRNAENVKGMPFMMYGIFCLTTFTRVRGSKF